MVKNVTSQDISLALSNPREPESEEKPQKSLNEKHLLSLVGESGSVNKMYYARFGIF
ncbi:hypothetical protein LguiB_020462 [Lonicera macranthoides]